MPLVESVTAAIPAWLLTTTAIKAIQIAVVGLFAVFSYRRDMLNATGAMVAFAMGAVIVAVTNIFWLLILFSLLAMGTLATKFQFAKKEALKVAEKDKGRRRSRNVVANGATPTLLAAASPLVAAVAGAEAAAVTFIAAVAVASSDTVASEIGSLAKRVVLITNLRPVPPGTDGGVSWQGQAAAAAGAAATAFVGYVLLAGITGELSMRPAAFLIPAVCGFLGCQVDSVIGATMETRGLVTKEEVNLISITIGAGVALAAGVLLL